MTEPRQVPLLVMDHRFERTPDGRIWSTMFSARYWRPYLDVWSGLRLVGRVITVQQPTPGASQVPAEIQFSFVPNYSGPLRYSLARGRIRRLLSKEIERGGAVIVRVPQTLGFEAAACCDRIRQPYLAEAIGDPWDSLGPRTSCHPLRPFFRVWARRRMRETMSRAVATSYVTSRALQERYPGTSAVATAEISNVEIDDVRPARAASEFSSPLRLLHIGGCDHWYKAQDVLLAAFTVALHRGASLAELVFVGDGRYRSEMERLARRWGVAQRVAFRGRVAIKEALAEELRSAQLFVLPSRQEGLPRALVEAMAAGLPAIGSKVGGIPELLPRDALVEPDNIEDLAQRIISFAASPALLAEHSAQNVRWAAAYLRPQLEGRRREFLRTVESILTARASSVRITSP